MSYWILGITIYWVGCGALVKWLAHDCIHEAMASEDLSPSTRKRLTAAIWALLYLVGPILMPFGIAYCIYTGWREKSEWNEELRVHHDHLCDPIHPANLPKELATFFDSVAPEFEQRGMSEVGDFLIAQEPFEITSRIFISEDGTVFGEAMHVGEQEIVNFTTVFDDGVKLDTLQIDSMDYYEMLNESGHYFSQMLGDEATFEDLYDNHMRLVRARTEDEQVQPRAFAAEQAADVWIYGKRLFNSLLAHCEMMDGPIPDPILPPAAEPHEMTAV